MSEFDLAAEYFFSNEGGLVENPRDPGGITNLGISLRFLQDINPEYNADDVRQMTKVAAKGLLKKYFWDCAPFEKIEDQVVCNYIFDAACNMNIAPAIKCAQRACWAVLSDREELIDDGILGEKSLKQINDAAGLLLAALRSERGGTYRLKAAENPTEKEFLEGWLNRAYRRR